MKDLNVTKKINIIENLKSSSLYKIADIFRCDDGGDGDKFDAAADLIILLYILSEKMGRSYDETNNNIVNRLKAGIKSEESEWRYELQTLLRHFEE